MDYNHITNFLDKFKKLIFQKEEIKKLVTETISKEIRHEIEMEKIKIKDGQIIVSGSPLLKGEILIHKKQIIEKINCLLPNNKFFDIK